MAQIAINQDLKTELDALKEHSRETYGDTIQKLILFWKHNRTLRSIEEAKMVRPQVDIVPENFQESDTSEIAKEYNRDNERF